MKNVAKPGVFEGMNFEVHRGEIVVLTGLRGCGAPEFAKAIFGLDGDNYSGQISYRGKPLQPRRGPARSIRDGMGFVTENRDKNGIMPPLSVADNVALPFLDNAVWRGLIDRSGMDTVVSKAISATATKAASPEQEIRFLSGGNKQKICLTRWLNSNLELLILLDSHLALMSMQRPIYVE